MGQLVEVAVGAKRAKCVWDDKTEEKILEVARVIRKELIDTPNTFACWPWSEHKLLSKKTQSLA